MLERDGVSLGSTREEALQDGYQIPDGHIDAIDIVALEDLKPIWNGADWLNDIEQPSGTNETNDANDAANSHINEQREYDVEGSDTNNWRHILTWTGEVGDGGAPQMIDFTWVGEDTLRSNSGLDRFSAAQLGHYDRREFNNFFVRRRFNRNLAIPTFNHPSRRYVEKVKQTIFFTRGDTRPLRGPGYLNPQNPVVRNRILDGDTYRLGDIINSSPIQFDDPIGVIDSVQRPYSDPSYQAYIDKYKGKRRRVTYVGSNDGMIHAFNGGFWNEEDRKFERSNSGEVPHALGAELWAYIPRNLLPHLSLLHNPGYNENTHIPMMDGDIEAFDVQIFTPDADHPNGWGTIIVAGMHLGGREKTVQLTNGSLFTGVSSYIVMDVTNPEKAPVLLAEVNSFDPSNSEHVTVESTPMRYTTARPTVKREGNNWYLMLGSGPTNRDDFTSDKQANILKINLKTSAEEITSTNVDNSFTGDLIAKRWPEIDEPNSLAAPRDESHDAVYFGLVEGTQTPSKDPAFSPAGGMYRTTGVGLNITPRALYNADRPIFYRPNFGTFQALQNDGSTEQKNMVVFGSGRELDVDDHISVDHRNRLYGVIEDDNLTSAATQLINVTNINFNQQTGVIINGNVTDQNGNGVINTQDLQIATTRGSNRGWLIDLEIGERGDPELAIADRLLGVRDSSDPSERSTAVPLVTFPNNGNQFTDQYVSFLTTYIPPTEAQGLAELATESRSCNVSVFGASFAYGIDLRTGVPPFADEFDGILPDTTNSGTQNAANKSALVGFGNSSDPILLSIEPRIDGGNDKIIKFPLSTRQIVEIEPGIPAQAGPPVPYRKSWTEIILK